MFNLHQVHVGDSHRLSERREGTRRRRGGEGRNCEAAK